jgi:hypothetical protein
MAALVSIEAANADRTRERIDPTSAGRCNLSSILLSKNQTKKWAFVDPTSGNHG